MKFLDPDHPFFAPMWRRWATTLLPLAWAGMELWNGSVQWALLFAAIGAYAGWMLLAKGPSSSE